MKSEESMPNYRPKVREYTNYAIKSVKNVCKAYGPRPVGSESEKQAQEYMVKNLESCCDEVKREEFKCSDKAFMSWVPIGAVLIILSTLAFTFGAPVLSIVFNVLALFFIVTEFIFYIPVLDVFFPKKTSGNVVGVRKPTGEVKRRIIVSGHTDSAFEWTYTYHGGRPAVMTIIITAIVDILLGLVSGIVSTVMNGAFCSIVWTDDIAVGFKIVAVVTYVCLPVIGAAIGFCNYKRPVTGANDNLTGTFISCAVAKFMAANNFRFENTEVMVLCVGGEEAGLRGSSAFAKAHPELLNDGVETIFIGLDTICELEYAKIYDKDMTGMVKNSPEVARLIQKAAKQACDIDVPIGTIELGATDAAAMSRAGFKASSMVMMDPSPARYYHTRLDTPELLSPKAIETGLLTVLEAAFIFDEKGLEQ